ncbi:MAG TPA: BON domain-containing protein [Candidatus Aquicultor sp.]|jgi:hypothetical protein
MAMRGEHKENNPYDLAAEETPETEDEILDLIADIYARDDRIDPTYTEAHVDNGNVTLEGSVRTQEELEMAESLLDNIEGINQVTNNLEVVLSDYDGEVLWPGEEETDEQEFEDIEVLKPDEVLVTEDVQDAVEEGKSYVPPTEPIFPTVRGDAGERMRERVAQREATGEAPDQL